MSLVQVGATRALFMGIALSFASASALADEFDISVNGQKVPREQIELIFKENQASNPDPATLKKNIRQNIISREVLVQQAIKEGLDKDPDFKLRQELAYRNGLASAYVSKFAKSAVTDAQVRAEFDTITKDMANGGQEYNVRHILVDDEKKAKALSASLLKNPKNFEALAKKESKDPGSATRGGELGWVGQGALVPEFEAAMIKLKNGEISAPVKTQFGFHIIRVDGSRKSQPPKFEEVKEQIKQKMLQQKVEDMVKDLVSKAKVQ